MQKLFLTASAFLISPLFAHAETTIPIANLVTTKDVNNIVAALVKTIAPSGTSVSNVSIAGDVTFNDDNSLAKVDVSQLNFRVAYLFFTDTETIRLTFSTPDGDCNNVQVMRAESSGTNSLISGQVKSYLKDHAAEIAKNFIIQKSVLAANCKVLPQMNDYELNPDVYLNRDDVYVFGDVELF